MSIDRRHSGTDLALGFAVGEQRECRWENRMFGAVRRVDVEGDRSWYVSDRLSMRYRVSVGSWKMRMMRPSSERETWGENEKVCLR